MWNQIGHLEHTSRDYVVSRKTQTKLKYGICVGLQIKELLRDVNFKTTDELELPAQIAFYWVCQNYLGNNTAVEYKDGINNLLEYYSAVGSGMSLKVLFLDSHLDFFPENLGTVLDERGEQGIIAMKKWCQSFWNDSMLADSCWININRRQMKKVDNKYVVW